MSNAAANFTPRRRRTLSVPQRVAHVVAVVLSAVLSVGLIGAVSAKTEPTRGSAKSGMVKKAAPAPPAVVMPALLATAAAKVQVRAAEAIPAAATERAADRSAALLHDENESLPPAPSAGRREVRRMLVTAYCPCPRCCGPYAQGLTASGKPVSHNGGRFVAADTSVFRFGTKLVIPGYAGGEPVEVIDRGGAIKGNRLDVYYPSHAEALQWGRRWVDVEVIVAD